MSLQKQAERGQLSEMDRIIDMQVDAAKLDDELFDKKGIRNDALESAMTYFV